MPNTANMAASTVMSTVSTMKMMSVADESSPSNAPFWTSSAVPITSSASKAAKAPPMTIDRMPNTLSGRGILLLLGAIA